MYKRQPRHRGKAGGDPGHDRGSGELFPLSHLPTACWVTPNREASSAWLMCFCFRHCRNSSGNDIVQHSSACTGSGKVLSVFIIQQKDVSVKRKSRFFSKKSCRSAQKCAQRAEILILGLTAPLKSGKLNRHSVRRVRVPTRRDVRVV